MLFNYQGMLTYDKLNGRDVLSGTVGRAFTCEAQDSGFEPSRFSLLVFSVLSFEIYTV